jgi:outer membrane protein
LTAAARGKEILAAGVILGECFEVNLQMFRPLARRTAAFCCPFLWMASLTLFPLFAGAQGQQTDHPTTSFSTSSPSGANESPGSVPDANPPVSSVPVTLKQAVQLALRQNPEVLIAKIAVSLSAQAKAEALSALLPQADLAAREAIIRFNVQSIIDLPAIGIGPRPVRIGPFQSETGGAVFSQQLLNLGLIRRYEVGRQGVTTARFDESTAREQITTAVVTQYLSVLEAMANETAVSARVALAQRLFDQAQRLEKTGVGTAIDTERAQVELQNEKQRLIDARTQRSTAVYLLAELLDLPGREEPQPTDTMRYFELPQIDRQQLISEALMDRPEMKALMSRQRQAELSLKAAGEQRLPTIEFSGFYDYQARRLDVGEPGYTYAFSLNVPLWTSGRIRAETAQARLEMARVAQERQGLEDTITQQVKTSLDQLQASRTAVDVADLGLKLANDEVARAERRFEAGLTTNIDVITAQDQLARADDNQIGALFRFNQARADWARAEGNAEDVYAR